MRKIELHLDAVIAIVLVFVAAVGFIAYQRHEYSLLAQDNMDRKMTQLKLEFEVARLEALLKRATAEQQAPRTGGAKAGGSAGS